MTRIQLHGNWTAAVTLLVCAAAATPLSAQEGPSDRRSHTRGLLLNLHVTGVSFNTDGGTDGGGGGGITIGYGVSRKVMIYAQFDGAEVELRDEEFPEIEGSYGLGHGDLGVRYSFANETRAFIPYLSGAFTGLIAGAEIVNRDVSLQGGGLKLGGGFGWYFIPQLALDASLTFTFGAFNRVKIDNVTVDLDENERANSTRLELGLSWYPQA